MCGAPWANNDWANFGSVEVFITYGEYSFSFNMEIFISPWF